VQSLANITSTLGENVDWDGKDPNLRLEMHFDWVSYDYAQTLGIEMAQGRFYSREFPSDAKDGIVLNERAVELMGIADPIGKRFNYWGKEKRIIGVTKNFFFQPLNETLKPMVLIYGAMGDIVYIRISPSDQAATVARIATVLKKFDPGATFDYSFFDDRYNAQYITEQRMLLIARYAILVAVVIACLGLFGLSAYTAERRTKEIGIRKVLGASTVSVLTLLTKESLMLVGVATMIAWPAAYIIADHFLQRYAYRVDIGVGPFVLSAAVAIAAALATVSYQAIRAARANPVDSLKYE
jgi:putative ABC transport system permease protein